MSDLESAAFNEVAANNNAASPNGAPEGMAPSGVNDTIREVMAAVKREWYRSHGTVASTGSANAYAIGYASAPAAYVNGQQFAFIASFANTGSATANINALGAKTIQKQIVSGMANLAAGDIQSGQHVVLEYDSSIDKLILLNPQYGSGLTTPVSVPNGGTGVATLAAHGVLLGEGTGNLVASAPGTAGQVFTSGGGSADGSYQNVSAIQIKTADYTLVAGDQGDSFILNSSSAHTFTLPDNATVGNGWSVRVINRGTGTLTIARAGTDTIASGGSTSLTSLQLSQGDAGDITADGVSHGIFYWRGVRHFESAQQTITAAGVLTLAHGLGVRPTHVNYALVCTTAANNYSVNDVIEMFNFEGGSAGVGNSIVPDATNLNIRQGAGTFTMMDKTSGLTGGATAANYKLIFRAWIYN